MRVRWNVRLGEKKEGILCLCFVFVCDMTGRGRHVYVCSCCVYLSLHYLFVLGCHCCVAELVFLDAPWDALVAER